MFKRNNKRTDQERGSLLAGAFMVSIALAISMVSLMSTSKFASHQAESLLSKSQLGYLVQEKFTRDLLALQRNSDLTQFNTRPLHFPWGEAQSSISPGPNGVSTFESPLYLVIVATLTQRAIQDPHHLRLETLLDQGHQTPELTSPTSPLNETTFITRAINDQLRNLLPEDDPRFEELKRQILSALEAQFGANLDSFLISVETNQYRDPGKSNSSPLNEEDKKETFVMNPLSINSAKNGLRIRIWKETYY